MSEPMQYRPADRNDPQLGRYELLFRLAAGGMAQIFVGRLAGAHGFQRLLVLKLIHAHYAQESAFIEMLADEARVLGRISHPNVVQVMELGEEGGTHFIAMEYVHGESLAALGSQARIPAQLCARIVADAAAGIHAAHELRRADGTSLEVVHRDLSPGNILISYDGAVKVTDFGVARARDNINVTRTGARKGKFGYMAPEYLLTGEADRRADVFSLGVVLYEITTGKRLYKGGMEQRLLAPEDEEVLPPSLIAPDYPQSLERIVLRALRNDPALRYQSALELQTDLERYIFDSGTPALASDLGRLVKELFADRRAAKQALIEAGGAELGESVEQLPSDASPTSEVAGGVVAGRRTRSTSGRERWLLLLAGLLLAASLAALIALALIPSHDGQAAQGQRDQPTQGSRDGSP